MSEMPQGFECSTCHDYHKFPGYVYAHWDEELIFSCPNPYCGERHVVIRGTATPEYAYEQGT